MNEKYATIIATVTGTEVGQLIIKGLELTGEKYQIISKDTEKWASGLYRCNKGYFVPTAFDEHFMPEIISPTLISRDMEVNIMELYTHVRR